MLQAVDILFYLVLLVGSLGAIALNIFSLPGNWLMLLGALLWSWGHGWNAPTPKILVAMLLLLLAAEVIEFLGGVLGARKFGASKTAAWAAIAGAMVGALVGTPVPYIGNLVGAVVGAFLAAWVVELLKRRPMDVATKAAIGAALGRGVGIFAKLGGGLTVWLLLAFAGFPL
jgi:uncharacterized protein YqgC (DUF456 family)